MYETETNSAVESRAQLPAEALRAFAELRGRLQSRTVLPWSEHCTECVWPTCYTTCDLYRARPDGGCRRFAEGMVRVDLPEAANSYLLKIRFKQWAKLWTPGSIHLHSAAHAETLENRDYRIGRTLQNLPLPALVTIAAAKKRYGFKKRVIHSIYHSVDFGESMPACFLFECYNPETRSVPLTLTMRAVDERTRIPFQKLIELTPGFHRVRISVQEITALLDLRRPFGIELAPNDEAGETTLFFGLMEFATEVAEAGNSNRQVGDAQKENAQDINHKNEKSEKVGEKEKKVKCVVWDLDNTLWDGILVEDGPDRLRLKPGIGEVIRELDRRGILLSIASKNNPEDALRVVKKFALNDYFLCPQISWQPKSQGIKNIAQQLNIGLDTLLFVDDSTFELEEVAAACPQVRISSAEQYLSLPQRSDCNVPVTDESRERRHLYQVETGRQAIAQNFSDDYMAFLRHCEIRLNVRPMTEENLERVHELTQRTNQMNFSGNRYDRGVLREILSNPAFDTFVLSCEDRFGSYGVIGFSIVDRRQPRMTDLMFSCRIQSKRVEHAFLARVIRKYIKETRQDFYADYRKTPRNAPSGQVFADLGMEEVETRDGVLSLRFPRDREVPEDGVIHIVMQEALQATPA
jgi:FkbH-like protein